MRAQRLAVRQAAQFQAARSPRGWPGACLVDPPAPPAAAPPARRLSAGAEREGGGGAAHACQAPGGAPERLGAGAGERRGAGREDDARAGAAGGARAPYVAQLLEAELFPAPRSRDATAGRPAIAPDVQAGVPAGGAVADGAKAGGKPGGAPLRIRVDAGAGIAANVCAPLSPLGAHSAALLQLHPRLNLSPGSGHNRYCLTGHCWAGRLLCLSAARVSTAARVAAPHGVLLHC